MTAPVVPDLGTDINARDLIVEVDLNNSATSPNWTPVGGVQSFVPTADTPTTQDGRRFSDGGYGRTAKTGTDWSAVMTCSLAPLASDSSQRDPAQEYLRSHGEGAIGSAAEVRIRWYEYHEDTTLPRIKSYAGTALVSYTEPNGGAADISVGTFTFTGQGKLLKPTHPYPVTPQVPNIDSVNPRNVSTAGGQQISINGQHFTGTTAVTAGGTNVTAFTIVSDSLIVATVPAHAAGTAALVVTNAAGASTTGGNLTYA